MWTFRKVDTDVPAEKTGFRSHWRPYVSTAFCVVVSFEIWHIAFPHTLWFTKLWCGFMTGGTVGLPLGYFWQMWDPGRQPYPSRRDFLGATLTWGFFSVLAFCLDLPDLKGQERQLARIRSLTARDVLRVVVTGWGNRQTILSSPKTLRRFLDSTQRAGLFYPSHELPLYEFSLTIVLRDGTSLTYDSWIPSRSPGDVAISFTAYAGKQAGGYDILLPDGRSWIAVSD